MTQISYQVTYIIGNKKIIENIVFDSNTKNVTNEKIAQHLNIKSESIIKYSRAFNIKPDIKDIDLVLVLTTLQSSFIAGIDLVQTLKDLLSDLYENKLLDNKISYYQQLSLSIDKILFRLNVNPVISTMLEAGIDSDFEKSIDSCIEYLDIQAKAQKARKQGFSASFIHIAVGITSILVLPLVYYDLITEIATMRKMTIDSNIYGILEFINHNIFAILTIIILFILTIAGVVKSKYYDNIKHYKPFVLFSKIKSYKEALVFLPMYSILKQSGLNENKIITFYKKINPKTANQLLSFYEKQNKDLATAIKLSDIGEEVAKRITPILDLNSVVQFRAIKNYLNVLEQQIINQSTKIARVIKTIGWSLIAAGGAMVVSTVVLIFAVIKV
jgi:hypothetical protein